MIYFIRELCDSDDEFLTIGKYMNKAIKKYKNRLLYIPINLDTPKKSAEFFINLREEISKFTPKSASTKIQRIIDTFGGYRMYVPIMDTFARVIRDDEILKLRNDGKTYPELSKMFNISQTTLRYIIETKKDSSY